MLLLSVGTIGIVIFYVVLARLSARMRKGLGIAPYHLWDYVACTIALSSIYVHAQLHPKPSSPDLQGLYISLLLLSNVIVILVSFKYWWWLKDELLGKSEQRGKSNE